MQKRIKVLGLGIGLLLLLFPLIIQAQLTTGKLRGYVTDDSEEPLPGVSIEISSESLMSSRSTVTSSNGAFNFYQLPPGRYDIVAKLEGFGTKIIKGNPVNVGTTSTVNIKMSPEALEETIQVTAEAPVIDLESSAKSHTVNIGMLETVPIAPRMNFTDIYQTLPGVAGSLGDAPYFDAGQMLNYDRPTKNYVFPHHDTDDSSENKVMVDGMEINDAMSGLIFAQFNYEAIEEINVKSSGASAEYGNARNSYMNIVTKSGGNELKGSFLLNYQPMSFNTTNIEGGEANKIQYIIPNLTLSGPIIKDKLWFLGSYKYDTEDYRYPHTIVVDKITQKTRAHIPYLKLTYQPHKNHTISAVYQTDYTEIGPQFLRGADFRRSTLDVGYTRKIGGPMVSGTWRWVISDSLYLNFTAGWSHKPRDYYTDTTLPRIRYTSEYRGTTIKYDQGGGEEYWSVRENVLVNSHFTYFVDDLWKTGSHVFKFGFDIRPYHHITRTRHYWKDEFGFYRYKYGLDYADYGLSEPYIWEAREAYPGDRYDNEGVCAMHDVFFQDNWSLTKDLTLLWGIRWEYQRETMFGRDELPLWLEEVYPKIRVNKEFEDNGFAPRLGLTYNWQNIGVFKFNFGKYFEYVGWNYHNYSKRMAFSTYRMDPEDFGKGPEALKIFSEGALAHPANHNDIDNLSMDYHWEFLASYERELFWNMVFGTTFIYRRHHITHQEEINAVFDENGNFIDRRFPQRDDIWRRTMYEGPDRRTFFYYKGLQFNLKKNFVGKAGVMVNYSRYFRDFKKLEFDPLDPKQFVYNQPSDLNMSNYGIRWSFHASFFYRLPWDTMISTFINGHSGIWMNDMTGDYAWNDSAPRVFLSNGRKVADIVWQIENNYFANKKFGEQGRFTDDLWQINLRLQKNINISRFRVSASIDIFNLFNSAAYNRFYSNDIRHPRYDEKRDPQSPRVAQLNLRIEF